MVLRTAISEAGWLEHEVFILFPLADGGYECISGNHRVVVLREMGMDSKIIRALLAKVHFS